MAETPFFDSVYDPLSDDGEYGDNGPRKRARFSRPSDQWRFLERTPSPEEESEDEAFEARNSGVQNHAQDGLVISDGTDVPAVQSSEIPNSTNNEVVTQELLSLEVQTQVATPASLAANDSREVAQARGELALVPPGLSNVSTSLGRGGEEVVSASKESEYRDAEVSEKASFRSDNRDIAEAVSEADNITEKLSFEFNAYQGKLDEGSNDHIVQYQNIAQQQQPLHESNYHHVPDSDLGVHLPNDKYLYSRPSPSGALGEVVSDVVHSGSDDAWMSRSRHVDRITNDDKCYIEIPTRHLQEVVTEPSAANTLVNVQPLDSEILDHDSVQESGLHRADARSIELSARQLQDSSAIPDAEQYDSGSRDESVSLDNDDEPDNFRADREKSDLYGEEFDREKDTDGVITDVYCKDPDGISAAMVNKTNKSTEIIEVDSEDDEEPVESDDEDNAILEDDSEIEIFENSEERAKEEHEEYEAAQSSDGDRVLSLTEPEKNVVEHDHDTEDSGEDSDLDENEEVANIEDNGKLSILDHPPELISEESEAIQHSGTDNTILFPEAATPIVKGDPPRKDQVEKVRLHEDTDTTDLQNDSRMRIREYSAEVTNQKTKESLPPSSDETVSIAKVAVSIDENIETDLDAEEELHPDEQKQEARNGLDNNAQFGMREPTAGVHETELEKTYISDRNEAMSIAPSASSVVYHGSKDEPDSHNYSTLAMKAVLQAELQESITMDEALNFRPDHPSSPAVEYPTYHALDEIRDSSDIIPDSYTSQDRYSFPFTPQPSGLSARFPEIETSVDPRSTNYGPTEVSIPNPISSFTSPDYDSVLDSGKLQRGDQLITPLPTQVVEAEEDDLKSQVELELEDEDSVIQVDEIIEDDTKELPLPVTPAASNHLIRILRRLRSSPVVENTKSDSNILSESTELRSDGSAGKENLRNREQSPPSEGEGDEISIKNPEHADAILPELSSPQNELALNDNPGKPLDKDDKKRFLQASQLGLRTPLSYFARLSALEQHFGSTIDIFAIVVSCTEASRAAKGPRHFYKTILLTDSSSTTAHGVPSCTTAQLFRPFKQALPILETGDSILLRNLKVQMQKHKPMLLSTESSAWAVFRKDTDVQIRGPHVEFGEEERNFAKDLCMWWHSLAPEVQNQLESNIPEKELGSKGKAKAKMKEKRLSEVVHELRDGTKYTDGGADINSIHELRDGTLYVDKEIT